MIDFTLAILPILLFLIPAYITNSTAMLFGGSKRLDAGCKLKGKEVLGKGKTLEGTLMGIMSAFITVSVITLLYPTESQALGAHYVIAGLLVSTGAITGDLAGSFIKRRLNMKPGESQPILDQLDFIIGGYAFLALYHFPSLPEFITVILLTLAVHYLSNYLAFKLHFKRVPW